jgi:hypothetical protein
MGISIRMMGAEFRIEAAEKAAALASGKHVHGHWVREGEGEACGTLEELLELWGYEPRVDQSDGSIVGLDCNNEKLGAELDLFKAIAPCVRAGSFIEMNGDYGAWRWVFDGATCVVRRPTWGDA